MSAPIAPNMHGDLTPKISWQSWALENPIPLEFGAWAQRHKLHARGSDSTASARSFGSVRSTLKRIWSGQKGEHNKDLLGANIWVMFDQNAPIGVVVFESSTALNASAPTAQKFCVNMWLQPSYRGRGLMGEMLREISQQVKPYTKNCATQIHAGDASVPILKKIFSVPICPLVIYSDTYVQEPKKRVRY